jgi:tRNA dimethylallyltransferase
MVSRRAPDEGCARSFPDLSLDVDATPLHFLVGPTASGKTAVALELAQRVGAEIVSMDSMLVYRGMDIGVAKPERAERERVPHHLIDVVEPSEAFSVHDFLAQARRAHEQVLARGRRALFVGGTAFYLKSMLQGLFDGPAIEPAVRALFERRYDEEGAAALHAELARVDPRLAQRVHPNDRKRVVRGLEVHAQTGRALSELQTTWGWHGAGPSAAAAARIAGLALEVGELDQRIAQRTNTMLARGWVEEALAIRAGCGFGPTAQQALGYREVLELADGRLSREECARSIALRTRQFARKQRTWLRKFESIEWFAAPTGKQQDPARVADEVLVRFGW